VASTPAGQFQVVLSDGLRIERLPVGFGAGRLWVTFVLSGIDFFAGSQLPDGRHPWESRQFVTFDGPDGPASIVGGAGGGGDAVQHRLYELEVDDVTSLRLTYLEDGRSIATEPIRLR
jgi:hypothetical protein